MSPEFQMCNAGMSAKIGQNNVESKMYVGAANAQLGTGKKFTSITL